MELQMIINRTFSDVESKYMNSNDNDDLMLYYSIFEHQNTLFIYPWLSVILVHSITC